MITPRAATFTKEKVGTLMLADRWKDEWGNTHYGALPVSKFHTNTLLPAPHSIVSLLLIHAVTPYCSKKTKKDQLMRHSRLRMPDRAHHWQHPVLTFLSSEIYCRVTPASYLEMHRPESPTLRLHLTKTCANSTNLYLKGCINSPTTLHPCFPTCRPPLH